MPEADRFPFDHLDATKLIPGELVPLRKVGRMVLNRWPDNFFAEFQERNAPLSEGNPTNQASFRSTPHGKSRWPLREN